MFYSFVDPKPSEEIIKHIHDILNCDDDLFDCQIKWSEFEDDMKLVSSI